MRKPLVLSIIALLGLAGCGGGSSDSNTGHLPAPDPVPIPTPPLTDVISDPENTFETASRALLFDPETVTGSITDQVAISAIRTDGDGGVHLTYVIGNTEETVHFMKSDLTENGDYSKEVNGNNYHLWANFGSFADSNYGIGDDFKYFAALGSSIEVTDPNIPGAVARIFTQFGINTGPDMPEGSATYHGFIYADNYDNTLDSISNSVARTRVRGGLELTASFGDSTLEGRIFNFRVRVPGDSSYESLSSTTQMDITNGAITDDGFTATLTGTDSNPDAPLTESIRGFTGDVSGRFYGPEAAELGGVFTATRAEDDRVMLGYLAAEKEREIATDSSSQFSALIHRDYGSEAASLSDATAMVEPTDDGYRITFSAGNTPHTFQVTDVDLGALGAFSSTYSKTDITDTASKRVWLWREIGTNPGRPYFDYLDVNGVSVALYTPGQPQRSDSLTHAEYGYVIRGTRTAANDMPSGTATYSGRVKAKEWTTDTLVTSAAPEYRGDLGMTADFGAGVVTGTVTNVGYRPGNSGSYTYDGHTSTSLTFEGTVNGNELDLTTANATGAFSDYTAGSAQGAFYGPQAAEVGGVLTAEDPTNNKFIHGWFAGDKD